jgi:hypothetical protein
MEAAMKVLDLSTPEGTIDAKLERIGSHIYKDFQAGHISFEVCEASLDSLNEGAESDVFGMPEHN